MQLKVIVPGPKPALHEKQRQQRKPQQRKKQPLPEKDAAVRRRNGPSDGIRVEIVLLTVLAVSILLMLSNFGVGGIVGNAVSDFFFGLFGISASIFRFFCLL